VWHDPTNSRSFKKAKYLGDIEAFRGNMSSVENYGYKSWSVHPQVGPAPEMGIMKVALYEGSDGLSLMFYSNKDNAKDPKWQAVDFDLTVRNNRGKDRVLLSDDGSELKVVSTTYKDKRYKARFRYKDNSDGGIIGPLIRKRFVAHFNMLKTNDIQSIQVFSGNGSLYTIPSGADSHFMIGHRKIIDCDMANNGNKISLLQFPRKTSKKTSTQFVFELEVPLAKGDKTSCMVDGNLINPCTPNTIIPITGLGIGPHKFQIDLIDATGTKDTLVYDWQVIQKKPRNKCLDPNKIKSKSVQVIFPDAGKTCKWHKGENLGKRNGYNQALRRQIANLNLPNNAKICDVDFNFPEQKFLFDDIFYLTLNDVVLASNGLFSLSQAPDGNQEFDWNTAKGMKFPRNFNKLTDQNYCFGETSGKGKCQWPLTEKQGKIILDFDSDIIRKISSSKNEIEMIVSGDNDRSDCRHSGLNFNVKVDYVD
jgi:hypothetical protein